LGVPTALFAAETGKAPVPKKPAPKPAPAPPAGPNLAADHHRPKYHFLPPSNWMNDPNGPIYWRGKYHMFYQYNPHAPVWGPMHWGHAVSTDMVHWRHLPVAMSPSPQGPDKDGVWSGCCVDDNGEPTFIYTGVRPEVQCLAISHDGLQTLKKRKQAVLSGPPEGLKVTGFRDPCVWKEDTTWYMALGSGVQGVGGMVLLYTSADLVNWTYLHRLFEGKMDASVTGKGPVASGEMWECPSFFPLGDKYMLFVSTRGSTPYWIGTYQDFKFQPELDSRLDWGSYYAPITQIDDRGRRILWGWIQERRSVQAQKAAGWSGVLSLPRVLAVNDGKLAVRPAPQLRSLRHERQQFVGMFIPDERPAPIPGLQGDALEIIIDIDPGDADEYGIRVLGSPDLTEATTIAHNRVDNRLSIGSAKAANNGNLTLAKGEGLHLHVFVDCSVIEVIANGRMCITERAYTSTAECTRVALYARGGTAKARYIETYQLKPISDDRMTT
jgi:beta-fructofuranosidase